MEITTAVPDNADNDLLAILPRRDARRLTAAGDPVSLEAGEVLLEPAQKIRNVWFPGSALVSLLTLADERQALEVGLTGRDGMVGVPLVLGNEVSAVRALVQGGGTALRLSPAAFQRELERSRALRRALYRYAHAQMVQISQTAACNRFHVVEQRLARRLLMAHDRIPADQFHMTHALLGQMLGVRRVGVTKAAQALQSRKLIRYSRGDITIVDRAGLEAAACRCYGAVRELVAAGGVARV